MEVSLRGILGLRRCRLVGLVGARSVLMIVSCTACGMVG